MTESQHGFPVFSPLDVTWFGPASEPIIGPQAQADIEAIRKNHGVEGFLLARKLVKKIEGLLDHPVSITSMRVSDPPGVGPRYACDLDDGYLAVCWVLEPPAEMKPAGLPFGSSG